MRLFFTVKETAFSLVEAVVAGVIVSIAATGVLVSLSTVPKPIAASTDKSLGAAYCGQRFLESLRAGVDARDFSSGKLALTSSPVTIQDYCAYNNTKYSITYEITQADTARKAKVTVSWP